MEIWKDIEGYEGFYQISSYGNVISCKIAKKRKPLKWVYMGISSMRYAAVNLYPRGSNKFNKEKIHILVAHHFIGPRPDGYIVDHIDGDRDNNRADNVQYITQRANVLKGKLRSLRSSRKDQILGAHFHKRNIVNPWGSCIHYKRESHNLGYYKTEEEAGLAYKIALSLIEEGKEVPKAARMKELVGL